MTQEESVQVTEEQQSPIKAIKHQIIASNPEASATESKQEGGADVQEEEANEGEEIVETVTFTLEEASDLFAAGAQALALSNFEEAAEKLALAVEAQVNHLGQMAIEVAPTFHLYGKALLATAVQKNGVLGEKADQVKPNAEPSVPAVAAASSDFVFEGDEEDDLEDDEGKVLDDIEIPLADDLELAWENLDLARVIFSQQEPTKENLLQLAEVHLSLGDVSLESENFDQAIKDYETALSLKLESAPNSWRELSEAHFKLGLALEYSEQNEEAVEQIGCAMSCIKKRMEDLESQATGKGKQTSDFASEARSGEIGELQGFLAEMSSKLADLNTLLEKEVAGELIAPPSAAPETVAAVNDISMLVKKRKVEKKDEVVVEASMEKKVKVGSN